MTTTTTVTVTEAEPVPEPAERPASSRRARLFRWMTQVQFAIYTFLLLGLLVIAYLWPRMFVVIPPGSAGVMYRTVAGGTVTDRTWSEGLHVIPPWDKMYTYNLRLQRTELHFPVLSDEGLELGVKLVVEYRPAPDMLGFLHKDIGEDYFRDLIQPEIIAHIRKIFGSRPAHEIYASVRDLLQELDQFSLIGKLDKDGDALASKPYVFVQALKLTQIELPKLVEDAIDEKYHQEQLMLAYRYRLEREEKEAERKRTEAAGIRDFNLIAGKVSPDMLRWRGIDAALDLAKSNNSQVIVFGSGGTASGPNLQLNLADAAGVTSGTEPPANPATPTPDANKPPLALTPPDHTPPPVRPTGVVPATPPTPAPTR
jgi:regulator of protease activity HflC (stomatin/prohibitin superfamily)